MSPGVTFLRTQIMLERWQHAELKALAEAEGVSISEVLRRLIDESFERRGRSKLLALAGIAQDGAASADGIDRIVYGDEGDRPGA